jgi:hypothetical protein
LVLLVALGAAGAAGTACGGAGSPSPEVGGEPDESEIDIHIISHNLRDANVYLYLGESRQRMGMAGGNQTTMFKVPWRRVEGNSRVRLLAELIGSAGQVVSENLQLSPGARVVWTLEVQLPASSVTVF